MKYVFMAAAILSEVMATTALSASNQFTRLWPSVLTLVGYALAFYFLSHALRYLPVSVAYAIWSGVGVVLVAVIGAVVLKQVPDMAACVGMALIVAGVLVMNLLSKTTGH